MPSFFAVGWRIGSTSYVWQTLLAAAALMLVATADAPAATRYLSASGADAGACASASTACRSVDHVYDLAEPGDVVRVAAGSYGVQTVRGTKSSPGVVFEMDPDAHFDDLSVYASWIEFRGGRIDTYGWWVTSTSTAAPAHVTFRNITARHVAFSGGSDLAIIGGSIGGFTAPPGVPAGVFLYGHVTPLSGVLIDGVDFHDVGHALQDDHFELVRIDVGAHDIAIRNSMFRNITANTSIIFVTNTYTEPGDPHDVTLENNFFAAPRGGPGGGAFYAINLNSVVQTCANFAFRYNSFAGAAASLPCPYKSNVSWIGNVGVKSWDCPGNTFRHNVWQWDNASTICGPTDRWVHGPRGTPSALGFVNAADGNLHLLADSPAINAGDAGSFPARDIDCGSRSGATPDAGADEYGSSGACDRPPAPDPAPLPGPEPPAADTAPPQTTITSGPAEGTTSASASVSFSSDEDGATFSCRLDEQAWADCTNPVTYTDVGVGNHIVEVRAVDGAGNVDPTPATVSWTVVDVFLLGNQNVEPQTDYNPPGQAQAYPFTAAAAGTIRTLNMRLDAASSATSLTIGIYDDTWSGHPGTLLDAKTLPAPRAGDWNEVTLPATRITAGERYWIAVLGGGGTLRYRNRVNGSISETSARDDLTSLPPTWSTGQAYHFGATSVWAAGLAE